MGVVLTGIMLVALTAGAMAYMYGARATTYLLNETPELQLVATNFGTDVQSSETVATPGVPVCGGSLPPGGAAVVDFSWRDYTSTTASALVTVSYIHVDVSNTHELRRVACRNGIVERQTTLASHIEPAQPPQLLCNPTCSATPTTPTRVDLGLQVCTAKPSPSVLCADDSIPANFTGVRRLA
jgi:hypothetical protein